MKQNLLLKELRSDMLQMYFHIILKFRGEKNQPLLKSDFMNTKFFNQGEAKSDYFCHFCTFEQNSK